MYLMNIISSIGEHYLSWRHVYNVIGSVLAILMAYKTVYWLIGLFFTRKFKPAKKKHKYAILILLKLLESMGQSATKDLIMNIKLRGLLFSIF